MRKWGPVIARIASTASEATEAWFRKAWDRDLLEAQRQEAIAFVQRMGVPIKDEDGFVHQWTGSFINAGRPKPWAGRTTAMARQHPSSILHDFAHWSVCSSRNRLAMLDFGLGQGPDSGDMAPHPMGDAATQWEEERASLLGMLVEYELGMPAGDTLQYHHWCHIDRPEGIGKNSIQVGDKYWSPAEPWSSLNRTFAWLERKGLIDTDGKVQWAKVSQGVDR